MNKKENNAFSTKINFAEDEEWIEEKYKEFIRLGVDIYSDERGRIYLPSPHQIKVFIRLLAEEIQDDCESYKI